MPGLNLRQTTTSAASFFSGRRYLLPLLLVVVGVLCWRIFFSGDRSGQGAGMDIPPVRVAASVVQDMPQFLNGLGTVLPSSDVLVTSRVDGHLQRLHFKEGQRVKAGDLLAEIDPRPFQAALDQAKGTLAKDQALLDNTRKDLARYAKLSQGDFIAAQQYETQRSLVRQYEGTVESDKAAVDSAALQLSYSRITAPVAGRLGLRNVDEGNMIKSSDTSGIVRITEVSPCDVVFTLPERQVPLVVSALRERENDAERKPLLVQAWDREQKHLLDVGGLLSLDNQIDLSTGTVKLKARFPNVEGKLYPNQFVNARLMVRVIKNVVTVPSSAIQLGRHGSYVYVASQNDKGQDVVAVRTVTTGIATDSLTVVEKGLEAGDSVVVDGLDRLRDGLVVKISTRTETPKAETY